MVTRRPGHPADRSASGHPGRERAPPADREPTGRYAGAPHPSLIPSCRTSHRPAPPPAARTDRLSPGPGNGSSGLSAGTRALQSSPHGHSLETGVAPAAARRRRCPAVPAWPLPFPQGGRAPDPGFRRCAPGRGRPRWRPSPPPPATPGHRRGARVVTCCIATRYASPAPRKHL